VAIISSQSGSATSNFAHQKHTVIRITLPSTSSISLFITGQNQKWAANDSQKGVTKLLCVKLLNAD